MNLIRWRARATGASSMRLILSPIYFPSPVAQLNDYMNESPTFHTISRNRTPIFRLFFGIVRSQETANANLLSICCILIPERYRDHLVDSFSFDVGRRQERGLTWIGQFPETHFPLRSVTFPPFLSVSLLADLDARISVFISSLLRSCCIDYSVARTNTS